MMEIEQTLRFFKIVVVDRASNEIVGYLVENERVLEVSDSPLNSIEFESFTEAYNFYEERIVPNRLMGLNPLENLNAIVSFEITTVIGDTVIYPPRGE